MACTFLCLVTVGNHHEVHELLTKVLGLPPSPEEGELVGLVPMTSLDERIQLDGPLRAALEGAFELASWSGVQASAMTAHRPAKVM